MKELDKEMKPYNNETDSGLNSTNSTNSTSSLLLKDTKKLSFAELESIGKAEDDKKEYTDSGDKVKRNSTGNFTVDLNYEMQFQNMTFAVNKTLNKGWPIRRDDGFPYQE
jgi:hypothetical protein